MQAEPALVLGKEALDSQIKCNPGWTDRPWRPVWAGYTPEQRRLIGDGSTPATFRQRELV